VVIARERRGALAIATAKQERVLDQIAREVAEAHALMHVRRQEIDAATRRIATAERAYRLDLQRSKNLEGHPIELLHSARLANAARLELIRATVGYNQAQFRLFVALGQPPVVPTTFVP
jgi:outer membrane protein TolC